MTRTVHAPAIAVGVRSVSKVYGTGESAVRALDSLTVEFPRGSFTAVMGPSGSGKSTLLQCAAGLDRPTRGSVVVDGIELAGQTESALARLRRERIGFVFQSFNLVPTLTVRHNVTLPVELAGRRPDPVEVAELLHTLGIAGRADHRPAQLSGGQQQRAAIARALLPRPSVVFADEPTGALDTTAAREVLILLRDTVSTRGHTVVMVTHDPIAASFADTVLFLADGRLVDTLSRSGPDTIARRMAELRSGGVR